MENTPPGRIRVKKDSYLLVSICESFINHETKIICEEASKVQYNVTIKGGNNRFRHLGKIKTPKECSEKVCGRSKAGYAFMYNDECYSITCMSECKVADSPKGIAGSAKGVQTRLIKLSRTGN